MLRFRSFGKMIWILLLLIGALVSCEFSEGEKELKGISPGHANLNVGISDSNSVNKFTLLLKEPYTEDLCENLNVSLRGEFLKRISPKKCKNRHVVKTFFEFEYSGPLGLKSQNDVLLGYKSAVRSFNLGFDSASYPRVSSNYNLSLDTLNFNLENIEREAVRDWVMAGKDLSYLDLGELKLRVSFEKTDSVLILDCGVPTNMMKLEPKVFARRISIPVDVFEGGIFKSVEVISFSFTTKYNSLNSSFQKYRIGYNGRGRALGKRMGGKGIFKNMVFFDSFQDKQIYVSKTLLSYGGLMKSNFQAVPDSLLQKLSLKYSITN